MLPLLLALNSGLIVESSSPDALCPPVKDVEEAVRGRLGSVELPEPWTLHYESVHRDTGDYVRLELRDPSAKVELRREFSGSGESCATLAQVMAVVVERYFRGLQSEDDSTTTSAPKLADQPPPKQRARKEFAAPVSSHAFEIGAALTAEPAGGALLRYVLERPGARALGFVAVELGVEPVVDREAVLQGLAERVSAHAGVWLGPRGWLGAHSAWRLGPLLLARFERVGTVGLAESSHGTRLVPQAGLGAGVTQLWTGPLALFVDARALAVAKFAAPKFLVDSREVFRLPSFAAGLDAGLRLSF